MLTKLLVLDCFLFQSFQQASSWWRVRYLRVSEQHLLSSLFGGIVFYLISTQFPRGAVSPGYMDDTFFLKGLFGGKVLEYAIDIEATDHA